MGRINDTEKTNVLCESIASKLKCEGLTKENYSPVKAMEKLKRCALSTKLCVILQHNENKIIQKL